MEENAANILIIDDEIGMRAGCQRALIPQGYRVSTAQHGAEGLHKLREEDFDIVLLDAMMPGMSGLEILERIQQHDPDIVCVMITGYATVDLAAQATKQGAHDFLPKPFTSDEWDEYLEKLDLRAGQLLAMLDDLLELANLKGRQGRYRPREVAVADPLESVAGRFRTAAEKKGLDFQIEILARPTILAQPAHVESLWGHLIENALDYTPQGRIVVTLDEEGDQIVASVRDTGIGISTEEMTRIFEDFYRGPRAREQVEFSTGLGLPIVHQIVQFYGGSVQVDSTLSEGSTFTVKLPKVPFPDSIQAIQ